MPKEPRTKRGSGAPAPPGGSARMTDTGEEKPNLPRYKYLNMSVVNADSGATYSAPIQATFTETRQSPIIYEPSRYELSVVRFSANGLGPALPLFIPTLLTGPGQSDPNLLVYNVTILNGSTPPIASQTQPVRFVTAYATAPVPVPPPASTSPAAPNSTYQKWSETDAYYAGTKVSAQTSPTAPYYLYTCTAYVAAGGDNPSVDTTHWLKYTNSSPGGFLKQDFSSPYYYVRSFTAFADMINTAIALAWTAAGITTETAPKLYYAPAPGSGTAGLFTFSHGVGFSAGTYKLLVNGPLLTLFQGFNWRNVSRGVAAYELTAAAGSTVTLQDFPSTDSGVWSPIDNFVFCTSQIPIVPEDGTVPVIVGSGNVGSNNGVTGGGFQSILTDFSLTAAGAQDNLNAITYSPQIYRMTSIISATPLQIVDISVYWRNRLSGELVPIYLPLNSSISLKIMFKLRNDTDDGKS